MEMGQWEFTEKLKKRDALKLELGACLGEAKKMIDSDRGSAWLPEWVGKINSRDTSFYSLDSELESLAWWVGILKSELVKVDGHDHALSNYLAAHRGMATPSIEDQAYENNHEIVAEQPDS